MFKYAKSFGIRAPSYYFGGGAAVLGRPNTAPE